MKPETYIGAVIGLFTGAFIASAIGMLYYNHVGESLYQELYPYSHITAYNNTGSSVQVQTSWNHWIGPSFLIPPGKAVSNDIPWSRCVNSFAVDIRPAHESPSKNTTDSKTQ